MAQVEGCGPRWKALLLDMLHETPVHDWLVRVAETAGGTTAVVQLLKTAVSDRTSWPYAAPAQFIMLKHLLRHLERTDLGTVGDVLLALPGPGSNPALPPAILQHIAKRLVRLLRRAHEEDRGMADVLVSMAAKSSFAGLPTVVQALKALAKPRDEPTPPTALQILRSVSASNAGRVAHVVDLVGKRWHPTRWWDRCKQPWSKAYSNSHNLTWLAYYPMSIAACYQTC